MRYTIIVIDEQNHAAVGVVDVVTSGPGQFTRRLASSFLRRMAANGRWLVDQCRESGDVESLVLGRAIMDVLRDTPWSQAGIGPEGVYEREEVPGVETYWGAG